jgi:hypothetical protein
MPANRPAAGTGSLTAERIAKKIMKTPLDKKAKEPAAGREKSKEKGKRPMPGTSGKALTPGGYSGTIKPR